MNVKRFKSYYLQITEWTVRQLIETSVCKNICKLRKEYVTHLANLYSFWMFKGQSQLFPSWGQSLAVTTPRGKEFDEVITFEVKEKDLTLLELIWLPLKARH